MIELAWLLMALPLVYVIWALGHETAHLLAAQWLVGVESWDITLWPRRLEDGSWRMAGYRWQPNRALNARERALISLAPRVPDVVAVVAFCAAVLVPEGIARWAWALFWVGGLVDLAAGSWGRSEFSDLRRAASALKVSPWALRAVGYCLLIPAVASVWLW